MDPNKPVHPTFLYESLWCLIGFLILYVIYKKFRKFSGQLFLGYGAWYGLGRMIIEGFRTDSLYIAHTTIRVSQVVSGVLMLVCLVLYIVFTVKYTKHPKPIEAWITSEDAVKTKKERLADEAAAMQAQTEETSAEKSEEVSEEAPEKEPEEKSRRFPKRRSTKTAKNGINQAKRVDKMAKLIDGKLISAEVLDSVRERVEYLKSCGVESCLAVIIVGDDPASRVYVNNKRRAAKRSA